MNNHYPDIGKMYILLIVCLIFSCLLISASVIGENAVGHEGLFETGITISIIQTLFTLYLIGIDLMDNCSSKKKCKWIYYAPCIYVYIPIICLSSAYMISFGILNILDSTNKNDEEIMTVSTASTIIGVVGILYIFSVAVCSNIAQ